MIRRPTLLLLTLTGCSGLFGIDFDGNGGSGANGPGGAGGDGAAPAGGSGGSGADGANGGGGSGGAASCSPDLVEVIAAPSTGVALVAFRAMGTGFVVVGNLTGGSLGNISSESPFVIFLDAFGEMEGSPVALTNDAVAFDATVVGENVYVVGHQTAGGGNGPSDGWMVRVNKANPAAQTFSLFTTTQVASGGNSSDTSLSVAPNTSSNGVITAGRCGSKDLDSITTPAADFSFTADMDGTTWSCPLAYDLEGVATGPAIGSFINSSHTIVTGLTSAGGKAFLVGYTVGPIGGQSAVASDSWFLAQLGVLPPKGLPGPLAHGAVQLAPFDQLEPGYQDDRRPRISAFESDGSTFLDAAYPTDPAGFGTWDVQRFGPGLSSPGEPFTIVAAGAADSNTLALRLDSAPEGVAVIADPYDLATVTVGSLPEFIGVSSLAVRLDEDFLVAQSVVPEQTTTTIDYALIENERSMVMVGMASGPGSLVTSASMSESIPGEGTRLFFNRACLP